MGGFNLQDELSALDFDFRPHADLHGTIPEPSDKQLRAFRRRLIVMAREAVPEGANPADITSPAQAVGVMSQLDADALDKQDDVMVKLVVDVCGDALTADGFRQVPPRGRARFLGWLVGNLLGTPENPTSSSPGTRGSLAIANGAAAAG